MRTVAEVFDDTLTNPDNLGLAGLCNDGWLRILLERSALATALVIEPSPGGPCYVVTREAWEAVYDVLNEWNRGNAQIMTDDVFHVLFGPGKVHVSKAVGTLSHGLTAWVKREGTYSYPVNDGDTVAVLED